MTLRHPKNLVVRLMVGFFVLGVLLLGCSTPGADISPKTAGDSSQLTSSPAVANGRLGQQLPIAAQVRIADQLIQLEVAKTHEQQALGLMYRTQLADNRGMLFSFNPPRPVSFWMKNVAIHLDMVFLRNGQVQAIASNVPPCKTMFCETYGPNGLVDQVIELRGGRSAELGIKVGDRLVIQPHHH